MHTCEIISVGTELLLGDILDTNARFLSVELAGMGIAVLHRSTVGDNPERLAEELRRAVSRNDLVILTGGLGPTADDLTKEVCCEVMGFALRSDEGVKAAIEQYFVNRSLDMPQTNLKQAMVPDGGTFFPNNNGTAPGIAVERDGKCVIMLPGPPREAEPMFINQVKPYVARFSDGAIVSHNVRTMGIGESAMAEAVGDLLDSANPTVAPYAKDGEALLRVTARADDADAADRLIAPVIDEIKSRLGENVYGVDVDSIQRRVFDMLRSAGKTVAFAESCTGGFTAKRLTDIPGASEVFECGVISYSNRIKSEILGVNKKTLAAYGAVSEQTACEMANGVRRVAGADIGVSLTGIAGPGSDSGKPAGLVYIALADGRDTFTCKLETGRSNDRDYNRYVAASRAFDLIRRYLDGSLK